MGHAGHVRGRCGRYVAERLQQLPETMGAELVENVELCIEEELEVAPGVLEH